MQSSETLDKLAPALVKAQAALPAVHKDSTNPHFKSKFASLDAIVDAALPVLHANGIALLQGGGPSDDGGIEVVTRLQHSSGEWVQSSFRLPLGKSDPQGAGSAITYGKRYGLAAMLGIVADEDDDAESTMGRKEDPKVHQRVLPPKDDHPRPRSVESGKVIPEVCPKCGGKVFDNRDKKASGEFKSTSPDWTCADKECKTGKYRTGGWATEAVKGESAGPGLDTDIPEPEDDDVPW